MWNSSGETIQLEKETKDVSKRQKSNLLYHFWFGYSFLMPILLLGHEGILIDIFLAFRIGVSFFVCRPIDIIV